MHALSKCCLARIRQLFIAYPTARGCLETQALDPLPLQARLDHPLSLSHVAFAAFVNLVPQPQLAQH
jgi:hypothetical protein|tara:strand:- start:1085 stop:1285 length:201 start_codon:yes stop_codon:yes gene_type:complete